MGISDDSRFAFDVQGYLHLPGLLSPSEVQTTLAWASETEKCDVAALQADATSLGNPSPPDYINRPVSRVMDADSRFLRFLDHPAVEPYLAEFLGRNYRHIDNELYYTAPGYKGGSWHRGVAAHPSGHVVKGQFLCPMVKAFYCLSDVAPGQGAFAVVPGSHRCQLEITTKDRVDLPGQHLFDHIQAGDVILFNEALLHTGHPNSSQKTRKVVIVNFGREDAGVWPGYRPKEATQKAASPRQREILSSGDVVWQEKAFTA